MSRATDFAKGPALRRYHVIDDGGIEHIVEAHFGFNNEGEGLIFRRYIDDNTENRTRVVASFAHGFWKHYKESE